jgi:hypothetical protein
VAEIDDARITTRMVFNAVMELREDLEGIRRVMGGIPEKVNDHEVRLRSLERYWWLWLGSASVAGGVVTQVGSSVMGKG